MSGLLSALVNPLRSDGRRSKKSYFRLYPFEIPVVPTEDSYGIVYVLPISAEGREPSPRDQKPSIDATPESYAFESERLADENPKDIAVAAVVRDMDITIQQVLDTIDELGIADNTYVFFSADHGAAGSNSNVPLREGKGSTWEGGIRVPLLIRGPGVLKGGRTRVRASQVDLYPTIAALAGVAGPLPADLEGGDLWTVLSTGSGAVLRAFEEFVVHFPHYDKDPLGPSSAILLGDYKLVRYYEDGAQQLYDLADDLSETNDLAAQMPDKVAELAKRMDDYLAAVDAQLPGHL